MTLYTAYADGRFAVNDRVHSLHDLTADEYLLLQADFVSGRYTAEQLFEKARERRSGQIS